MCLIRALDPCIAACFAADNGSARQLAHLLSHSVTWQPALSGEAATSEAVNNVLINVLRGIDRSATVPPVCQPASLPGITVLEKCYKRKD